MINSCLFDAYLNIIALKSIVFFSFHACVLYHWLFYTCDLSIMSRGFCPTFIDISTYILSQNWFNKLQHNHTLVFDDPCPGAPKMATIEDNVTEIHDLLLADRRLKVFEIAEIVGISKDCMDHILLEILGMRKLSARWMPHLFTPDNKRNCETNSEQCLTLFKCNPKEFLHCFMTVDETWIHWYTPKTKEQSKEWTSPGERAPK